MWRLLLSKIRLGTFWYLVRLIDMVVGATAGTTLPNAPPQNLKPYKVGSCLKHKFKLNYLNSLTQWFLHMFCLAFRSEFMNTIKGLGFSISRGFYINSCYTHCQTEMQETWFGEDSPILDKKVLHIFSIALLKLATYASVWRSTTLFTFHIFDRKLLKRWEIGFMTGEDFRRLIALILVMILVVTKFGRPNRAIVTPEEHSLWWTIRSYTWKLQSFFMLYLTIINNMKVVLVIGWIQGDCPHLMHTMWLSALDVGRV